MRSYSFALHVDFALRTFPYLRFHLDGTGSYQRPDLYSIHFRNVPWFGKGFENIKMDPLEPVTWPQTYDIVTSPTTATARSSRCATAPTAT